MPDAELRTAFVEDLKRVGVPVQMAEDGDICYPAEKSDFVRSRFLALVASMSSPNHITIEGGEFARRMLVELDKAKIEFKYSDLNATKVLLIVAPEDVEEVEAISFRVAQAMATKSESSRTQ